MQDSAKYKDYVKNETIEEIEIVDSPYHSTLCSNCRTVCHNHCGLQETTTQGNNHPSSHCLCALDVAAVSHTILW